LKRPSPYRYFLFLEAALSLGHAVSFTVTGVYFVREVGLSPLQLVLVGTVMEAAIVVCEIPTGVFADTFGRRRSLILGWAGTGAAMVLVGSVAEVWAILAGYALWGLAYTFTSGAHEAWIVDEVGVERAGRAFVRGEQVGNVGALAGIGVSVALATVDLGLAIVVGGLLVAAVAVASIGLMPETGFVRAPRAERPPLGSLRELQTTALRGGRLVRAQPLLLLFVLVTFFTGMSSESMDRLWEAQLIREVGLPGLGSLDPVVWFGIIGAVSMLIAIAATGLLARRVEHATREWLARALVAATVVQALALVLFALAGGLALALGGYWVYRLTRAVVAPLQLTWLNRNIGDSTVRATVISMTGLGDAIGQSGGGPALGAVGNALGLRAALLAGAAVLAPALGLFARAARHHGREPELEALPASGEA
jgi:DHA3 family tetracycline resistance protein-like MFS transporter